MAEVIALSALDLTVIGQGTRSEHSDRERRSTMI